MPSGCPGVWGRSGGHRIHGTPGRRVMVEGEEVQDEKNERRKRKGKRERGQFK